MGKHNAGERSSNNGVGNLRIVGSKLGKPRSMVLPKCGYKHDNIPFDKRCPICGRPGNKWPRLGGVVPTKKLPIQKH